MWWISDKDERFWIYLAGFIDGEGCLGIYRAKRKNAKDGLRPYIAITNTDKEIMDAIKKTIPKKVYCSMGKSRRKKTHKFAYNLRIENYGSVLFVLEKIKPYLTIKRERANLLLQYILIRKSKEVNPHCFKHLGQEEYEIYKEIRKLNKKGVQI